MNLLDLMRSPWALQLEKLQEIQAIYATHLRGEKIDIAAIEARLGHTLANEQKEYAIREGGVAVLPVEGVLAPKANLFMRISGGASTYMLQEQVESAESDPRVRSLVLAFDTPGGAVQGIPEFAETIYRMSHSKPVVAWVHGTMASAGVWSGTAANAIYVSGPTVQVGNIGVVAQHTWDPKAGETKTEITAGKYKRIASSQAPLTAEGRAYLQADVDYVYSLFVDAVAKHRGASAEKVLEHMADGRDFRGQQAIDAGLVDGVSTLDALVEQLATNPAAFAARRKAVFAVGALPSPSAGAAPKDPSQPREKDPVMSGDNTSITRASFEQDHAALFAQVRSEFLSLGATQERERIQAVLAVGDGLPGHEKLLNALAYDGKTSAAEASIQVLSAEKQARAAAAQAHVDDAPPPAKPSNAPNDPAGKSKAEMAAEAQAYAATNGVDVVTALKRLGYA